MSIPLVVVRILTYNHELFIEECIQGVINQKTNFSFKVVLSDDCSTDNTFNICEIYKNKYPELFILTRNDKNNIVLNSKKNWEKCFELNPKYIALLEGDDYWTDPYKLQKQVDLMEKTNSDFCYTDFDIYHEAEGEFQYNIFENKLANINIEHPLLTNGSLGVPSWVFKSEFLKSFNPNKHNLIDKSALMLLEFLRTNGKVCYLPESTTVYRRNLNSSSNQQDPFKRYVHHKLSFEFMLDYFLQYYVEDEQTRHKINMLSINILSEAHDHHDVDLIKRIKSFLKESEIDITQILNKFQERNKYKENHESLENSRLRRFLKFFIKSRR